jgi:ribonuclease E
MSDSATSPEGADTEHEPAHADTALQVSQGHGDVAEAHDTPSTASSRGAQPRGDLTAAPYVLPLDELHRIAQDSGLQWVNSDADKIAAAQAAIAAEPKPVHIPREPKPPVVIDEGPLILVETRKDLSQVKLPFEA